MVSRTLPCACRLLPRASLADAPGAGCTPGDGFVTCVGPVRPTAHQAQRADILRSCDLLHLLVGAEPSRRGMVAGTSLPSRSPWCGAWELALSPIP